MFACVAKHVGTVPEDVHDCGPKNSEEGCCGSTGWEDEGLLVMLWLKSTEFERYKR